MTNTLFLRLEGPLQSWGERARWSVRDTAPEPTKSGIVGLLGCALGMDDDEDLRCLSVAIHLGVRCDRPGKMLVDYHTVVGGVMSAEGKVKKSASTGEPETVVSWRYYLSDASFLAAVQSEDTALIDRLAQAVCQPVWPIYLGRKSCPPSRPVFAGVGTYSSLVEALETPLVRGDANSAEKVSLRAVVECTVDEGGVRRKDEVDRNSLHRYLPRYTRDLLLTVGVRREEA